MMRLRCQLERQRQHPRPRGRTRTESSTQRACRQYRHRKRPVFAVAPDDRRHKFSRSDAASVLGQPSFRSSNNGAIFFIGTRQDAKRRPAERRGADVTDATNSVAPTTVGIDVAREPIQSAPDLDWDLRIVNRGFPCHDAERANSRGGRKRAAGEFANPVSPGCASGEQFFPGQCQSVTKSLGEVQGLHALTSCRSGLERPFRYAVHVAGGQRTLLCSQKHG